MLINIQSIEKEQVLTANNDNICYKVQYTTANQDKVYEEYITVDASDVSEFHSYCAANVNYHGEVLCFISKNKYGWDVMDCLYDIVIDQGGVGARVGGTCGGAVEMSEDDPSCGPDASATTNVFYYRGFYYYVK